MSYDFIFLNYKRCLGGISASLFGGRLALGLTALGRGLSLFGGRLALGASLFGGRLSLRL